MVNLLISSSQTKVGGKGLIPSQKKEIIDKYNMLCYSIHKLNKEAKRETLDMSEKYPECPLYNPMNCKEYYNPKICAFARSDKSCTKKKKPEMARHKEGKRAGDE